MTVIMKDAEFLRDIRARAEKLAKDIGEAHNRGYMVGWESFQGGKVVDFFVKQLVDLDIDKALQ